MTHCKNRQPDECMPSSFDLWGQQLHRTMCNILNRGQFTNLLDHRFFITCTGQKCSGRPQSLDSASIKSDQLHYNSIMDQVTNLPTVHRWIACSPCKTSSNSHVIAAIVWHSPCDLNQFTCSGLFLLRENQSLVSIHMQIDRPRLVCPSPFHRWWGRKTSVPYGCTFIVVQCDALHEHNQTKLEKFTFVNRRHPNGTQFIINLYSIYNISHMCLFRLSSSDHRWPGSAYPFNTQGKKVVHNAMVCTV